MYIYDIKYAYTYLTEFWGQIGSLIRLRRGVFERECERQSGRETEWWSSNGV